MLKNLLYLLLISVIAIIGCKSASHVKEFEGIITYKTSRTSWRDSNQPPHTGDTITIYYSHGNTCKIHTSDSTILKKEIYIAKGAHYYFEKWHVDTLYWYDVAQTEPHAELSSLGITDADTTILGHPCKKANLWMRHDGEKGSFYTESEYLFSNECMAVDNAHWATYNFGYFNKMIDRAGHYYLGYRYKLHSRTNTVIETAEYTAIDIKEQKIDPQIFEPDKLPLKEFKIR